MLTRKTHRLGIIALGGVFLALGCGGGRSVGDDTGAGVPADDEPAVGAAAGSRAPEAVFPGTPAGGLPEWIEDIRTGLDDLPRRLEEDPHAAGQEVVQLYLSRQEYIERYYGAGGPRTGGPDLSRAVTDAETAFHELMRLTGAGEPDPREAARARDALLARLDRVLELARGAAVPLDPPAGTKVPASGEEARDGSAAVSGVAAPAPGGRLLANFRSWTPKTPEVRRIVDRLRTAESAVREGDRDGALAAVEAAYLDGFEPLEARVPFATTRRIERLIHLELRPKIARGGDGASLDPLFAALHEELAHVDGALATRTPFAVAAAQSFAIIFREGLEAALLIAAILAYLSRVSPDPRHGRQVLYGVGLGVLASFGTWILARLVIPVGGASRELIEGITALIAVVVLLYVSNWLFQKTYVHDWKEYLTEHVGRAVSTGSALTLAALAFAAVYREGFETVLFYQTLLFDSGPAPIVAGFLPGLLLIGTVAVAIVRIGLRLPLRRAFAVTNAILIYLAFVFVGKGMYNLQEAGVYSPSPIGGWPDHGALRQVLGVFPIAQTLAAQACFVLLVAASYAWYRRQAAARLARPTAAEATP